MPCWHNFLEVLLFVAMPAVFLGAYFFLLGTVETQTLFLYFTFTLVHTVFVTVWFLVVLIDIFEGLKKQNLSERNRKQAKVNEGAKNEKDKEALDMVSNKDFEKEQI